MRPMIIALAAVCSCATPATAQPKAFVCEFTSRHIGKLETSYQSAASGDRLSLTFASIDLPRRAAQMIGNAGAVSVTVIANEGRMHFVEITDAGNLSSTSVFVLSSSAEQLPAVHSRHMSLSNAAVVSQYTGTCTPRF